MWGVIVPIVALLFCAVMIFSNARALYRACRQGEIRWSVGKTVFRSIEPDRFWGVVTGRTLLTIFFAAFAVVVLANTWFRVSS
jgi:hypothetical protein